MGPTRVYATGELADFARERLHGGAQFLEQRLGAFDVATDALELRLGLGVGGRGFIQSLTGGDGPPIALIATRANRAQGAVGLVVLAFLLSGNKPGAAPSEGAGIH